MGKNKEFKFDIVENFGPIEESKKNNWGTLLTRISWNGKSPVYDLRKYDMSTIESDTVVMGKGVSIEEDESMDRLVHLLLEIGFGDTDKILDYLETRESIYDYGETQERIEKLRKVIFKRL